MIRRMGVKQVTLLLLGLGYLGLFFDAYVGHALTGSGLAEPPQYVPLYFSPAAFAVLLWLGVREVSVRTLARTSFWLGGLSAVVGLAGVFFHLLPMVKELSEQALTTEALKDVLGSVPPLLAPGAFFAVGVLVMAVGAARVRISLQPVAEAEPDAGQANAGEHRAA
ncbi:MAG: hypothetical protein M3Y59_19820 [Myxococcota bacterium]|nr:hypothetical protein [Myxococcota bacterium]